MHASTPLQLFCAGCILGDSTSPVLVDGRDDSDRLLTSDIPPTVEVPPTEFFLNAEKHRVACTIAECFNGKILICMKWLGILHTTLPRVHLKIYCYSRDSDAIYYCIIFL